MYFNSIFLEPSCTFRDPDGVMISSAQQLVPVPKYKEYENLASKLINYVVIILHFNVKQL